MGKNERFVETFETTVYPDTHTPVNVGDFSIGETDDTIWFKVTSAPEGGCPWPWSYGLLTWVTDNGRELGTVKVNGVCEGEVFRLGVGRAPSLRNGRIYFEPRSYNLAWVKLGHPWTLTIGASSGTSSGGGSSIRAVTSSLVDTSNNGLSFVRVDFS